MKKSTWITIAKLCFGIGLLALLFGSGKVEFTPETWNSLLTHWGDLALGQVFFAIAATLTFIRWRMVLKALSVPSKYSDVMRLGWIGILFSQVVPGSTGGDVVKGYYIARESPNRRAEAVVSVFIDRVLGLTGLMILGSIAIAFKYETLTTVPLMRNLVILIALGIVGVISAGALFSYESFWRKDWVARLFSKLPARNIIARVAKVLWALPNKRRVLVNSLAISLLSHSCLVLMAIFLYRAMNDGAMPPVALFFFLVPIGNLASALPLSPGGLGVGEVAYAYMFSAMGQEGGAELMLLIRSSVCMWGGLGLFFYLRGKKELDEAQHQAEEESKHNEQIAREQALASQKAATGNAGKESVPATDFTAKANRKELSS